MSIFYSHLIEIESILIELDKMELSPAEKRHLAMLVDNNLHNAILDAILSELSESDKRVFLTKLTSDDNTKIWEFLSQKIDKVEDKIKNTADKIKQDLHEDIKQAHELRKKA